MAPPAALETNMRKTTEAFLYGFDGDWTPGMTMSTRAPDCVQEMLPKWLGYPTRSKDEWAAYFRDMSSSGYIKSAKMTIDDYVASPSDRRAVARSSMQASTPLGPFLNEYVWFFTFNEDGTQIVRISEFLDTAATQDFRRKKAEFDAKAEHA